MPTSVLPAPWASWDCTDASRGTTGAHLLVWFILQETHQRAGKAVFRPLRPPGRCGFVRKAPHAVGDVRVNSSGDKLSFHL